MKNWNYSVKEFLYSCIVAAAFILGTVTDSIIICMLFYFLGFVGMDYYAKFYHNNHK